MVYFDHNATTPLPKAARAAWLQAADEAWHNPSSPYRASARVRNLLEGSRGRLAEFLGCRADEVVFNSGATEANNALFTHLSRRSDAGRGVLLSPVEHPCVLEAASFSFSGRVTFLNVDGDGVVDPEDLRAKLRETSPLLVSVQAANNETGVIQPFQALAKICREHGVWFHCDAAQWFGKLPGSRLQGCDFVTGSAHKFGGPKGTGFLRVPSAADDFRGQLGGEQEHGHRAGTENYPSVAAMLAALEEREAGGYADLAERASRRNRFESRLLKELPGAKVVAMERERLWNTVSILPPRYENHGWVMKLDREGFAVSTGSACASGSQSPSHVLAAMGYTAEEARRVVRVSAGPETREEDWLGLAQAFGRVWRRWEAKGTDSSLTEVISI